MVHVSFTPELQNLTVYITTKLITKLISSNLLDIDHSNTYKYNEHVHTYDDRGVHTYIHTYTNMGVATQYNAQCQHSCLDKCDDSILMAQPINATQNRVGKALLFVVVVIL